MPSGILNPKAVCVIGNGCVVHLPTLMDEIASLEEKNIEWEGRLLLSDRAHVVFDFHRTVDGLREKKLSDKSIGTTKRGIGPTYASKMNRDGIRVGDLQFDDFPDRLKSLVDSHVATYGEEALSVDVDAEVKLYQGYWEKLQSMVCNTVSYVNNAIDEGKTVLVEGANATMLDIDFGTYPYVTSSNCSVGGACTGLGVSPMLLKGNYGVVKAYTTRVGEGPFVSELEGELHDKLATVGHEVGTTTGRGRRCGWLDIVQMKWSQAINRWTHLNLTKIDVLSEFDEIKVCVAYEIDGEQITEFPSSLTSLENAKPVWETFEGWGDDITGCRKWDELPEKCQLYVNRIEKLMGAPIKWIGVGPGRSAMVFKE
eukprot:TRINITY_DN1058_c0_g3_i4.p1 TRINITY_DN1058_c0_g3~~TRINITY_DN1058_c0_g3_i4.p1  ORF type:complete len:369 (-),score=130.73 TRINITY_DN1058_c0_g3_i4:128-1234(-)